MSTDDRMETNPTRANGGPVRGDAPLVSGECPYPAVMATRYPDRAIGTVAGVTIIESHDPQASTYAEHMETITDRAEIRATDEPDERTPNEVHVDESGCSCKTGPYRGFQRDPIDAACPKHGGPLRHGDGDVTVCHPDGSTTIIREPDERGDFPFYDLGPATSEARAAGGVDPKALAHALTTAHALIEAKAQLESVRHLLQLRSDALARVTREAEALRAKVAAAEALADQWADRKRSDGMSGNAWIGITLAGVAADLRAALATTGEGK